jgi:hypothetical protein
MSLILRPSMRARTDPQYSGLDKQENLASFCQDTTWECDVRQLQPTDFRTFSILVRALKTRGLHTDGARALGAHNVPISLVAQGKTWHLVDVKVRMVSIVPLASSRKVPQKSSPVRHVRAITVARTQQ